MLAKFYIAACSSNQIFGNDTKKKIILWFMFKYNKQKCIFAFVLVYCFFIKICQNLIVGIL